MSDTLSLFAGSFEAADVPDAPSCPACGGPALRGGRCARCRTAGIEAPALDLAPAPAPTVEELTAAALAEAAKPRPNARYDPEADGYFWAERDARAELRLDAEMVLSTIPERYTLARRELRHAINAASEGSAATGAIARNAGALCRILDTIDDAPEWAGWPTAAPELDDDDDQADELAADELDGWCPGCAADHAPPFHDPEPEPEAIAEPEAEADADELHPRAAADAAALDRLAALIADARAPYGWAHGNAPKPGTFAHLVFLIVDERRAGRLF